MSHSNKFTHELREWRKFRNLSQLDLALAAEISQRHVSWLETAKSHPSREMVIRLSEALDIPLRNRNRFLVSAGYAPLYTEHGLNEPAMEPIKMVLDRILTHHEPYPAFVLDRFWNIHAQNRAANWLVGSPGKKTDLWQAIGDDGKRNIALLILHPNGIKPLVSNWNDIAQQMITRLKKEALDSGDTAVMARYESFAALANISPEVSVDTLLPVLTLKIKTDKAELGFCSVISTLGTAQDITANEIRVEAFYPMDDTTDQYLKLQQEK